MRMHRTKRRPHSWSSVAGGRLCGTAELQVYDPQGCAPHLLDVRCHFDNFHVLDLLHNRHRGRVV
ncbi:hypothetical protein V5799_014667, partial [Amblyomma americanum]